MLCSHTPVIQLATNISYFFSKINYFIITHMTSLHCALCPLSNASYNIQAEYIYKIFSKQFFPPCGTLAPFWVLASLYGASQ